MLAFFLATHISVLPMSHLETLTAQVQRYAALTERPEADFSSISRALAELNCAGEKIR